MDVAFLPESSWRPSSPAKKLEICLKMNSAFIRNIAFVTRPTEITIALYSIDVAIAT